MPARNNKRSRVAEQAPETEAEPASIVEDSPAVEPAPRPRKDKRSRSVAKPARAAEPAPIQDEVAGAEYFPPKKKSKPVNPMFAGIIATLEGAEDLNEHCRAMLIAMAPPSLTKAKSDRHDMQQLGVTMIEEALEAHKTKLVEAVDVAQKELAELEGSKNEILKRVDNAQTSLTERQAAKTGANLAHEQACTATRSAEEALASAQKAQDDAEITHAAIEKEKIALDTAFLEHFTEPMANSQGPHYNFLKPFMENLGLEESLINALPSSCVKTKDQRGGFDDLVLSEFHKALVAKQNALQKSVTDEVALVAETKAAVVTAYEAVQAKRLLEQDASTMLQAATAAQSVAEEEVSKASEAWTAFEPRVREASATYDMHNGKCKAFEDGTLKTFETLRDKDVPMPVEAEAATAGA